jgi:type II secretory pathway pseudopilin PulG
MVNIKSKKNMRKGFTLVEALVAISILMIAIASPLTLAQRGISAAILSRDQMTASFLAQDGIEAVKNIRDQIAITGRTPGDWLEPDLTSCICTDSNNGLDCSNFVSSVNYCNIDTTGDLTTSIKQKGTPGINPMKISTKPDGTFIKYDLLGTSATSSKFSRYINVTKSTTNPNEAIINARVSWVSPLGIQNITIKDFIYNYSENF